jgi:hypothetical protein
VFAGTAFRADAANYHFVNIADSAAFTVHLGAVGVSINNHGTVAFVGSPIGNVFGVYTGAGGPISTIADNSGVFQNFQEPSINDNGIVFFWGQDDSPLRDIFASDGGPVTTIAETTYDPFPREVAFPVVNSQGTVAFYVFYSEHDPTRLNFAIKTSSGGPQTLIADSSGPLFHAGHPDINNNGTVAFAALLDGGGAGIFTGNGGPLTTVLTGAAGFTAFGDPTINADGTLAFYGERSGGVVGIYTTSDGPVTTIADSSGPFSTINLGDEALINASGTVAFWAPLDAGGSGLFTGPHPVADKVIRTGDSLFGSTVTAVGSHISTRARGTFDINDNGDVAFVYQLANGLSGIAVARVVIPEPESLVLLATAVLSAMLRHRRCGATYVRLMVIVLSCALVATGPSPAVAANYNFISIADTTQFPAGFNEISLNNRGQVAFAARTADGRFGVFVGDGGPITTIVDDSGEFDSFRSPSINDSGLVAFYADYDGPGEGIFTSDGGPVTRISDSVVGLPQVLHRFPVINASGSVAFRGLYGQFHPSGLNFSIHTGTGGPLTLIADSSGPLLTTGAVPLHMNDYGTVAFSAASDGGRPAGVTGDGGPLTIIDALAAGFNGFSQPSINNHGTLAFISQRVGGAFGVFTIDGGPAVTIADTTGPFANFGRDSIINDDGQVAFRASLDAGGQGTFTGPDPVADKVIRTGDALFGSTVTDVNVPLGADALFDLNDRGDVAFVYELANGVRGIAVARLVPEPAALILLIIGIAAAAQVRRRAFDRSFLQLIPAMLLCPLFAGFALPATAANYQFIKIVDSSGPFLSGFLGSISSDGTVAFRALRNDFHVGIFVGNGGPITTITDTSGPFRDFLGFPTINADGTVAFHATFDDGGTGIFTGSGGPLTTIADESGPFSGFTPGGSFSWPAINSAGAVAFRATLDAGGEGIFVGSGGPTTTIADSSGPFQNFGTVPDLNAAGTAVFEATYDAGGKGIFTGSGGPTTTIADTSGPYFNLLGPGINDSGEVAFWAEFDDHFRPNIHQAIIKSSGGATTTVAATNQTFFWIPGNNPVSINNSGDVHFKVELQNARPAPEGLYTGPDPVADKVIAFGDPLFGSTVRGFGFTYRSISDRGDIVFSYGLANGESGIAVARLVPEPSSLAFLLIPFAAAITFQRRRSSGGYHCTRCGRILGLIRGGAKYVP